MDPEMTALFRAVADRSPSERAAFYDQRGVPLSLRSQVESLLRFDRASDDSLNEHMVAAVEDALLAGVGAESVTQPEPSISFNGTDRFVVQRRLGEGAFGTVYEVWDREQQVTVAVKVLHQWKPDLLFRFKREFRALIDVRHRNLVRLYELFSETDQWFFSMELVDGENFLEYVRPGAVCNLHRLKAALGQLTEGIRALHAARCLHRDVKPANALVTADGRVVVLDFGLVHEVDALLPLASRTQVAGTPAYMAPEQLLDGSVCEASDWYAVGVVLFQALTGVLPHTEPPWQRGQIPESQESSVDPREIDPRVPDDLAELCRRLLKAQPEERPDAAAILSVVADRRTAVVQDRLAVPPVDHEPFVGRSEALRTLETAFADTQEGRLNVVFVHGPSGIGKTALVRHFLSTLDSRQTQLTVLKGRCYEFESVPYKGLDALVDECSRYLQRLPQARVEGVLPRDACLLPKLFPVLARVEAIASAPARSAVVPDIQELRQRTFKALRELFARLSDRQPLVIWIDDLQWSDRDSSAFLAELCAPPLQPPLLLVLTCRSEGLDSNATLTHLQEVLANQRLLGRWHNLAVDELSDAESRQLLHELLPHVGELGEEAHTIVREARGHPLFLQQLARVAGSLGTVDPTGGETFTLRTVLQERIRALPAFARELLEFACLAAQPLTPATLFAAVEGGEMDDRAEAITLLIHGRLARSSAASARRARRVEPFHDQVRSAVVDLLTADTRRARHARLARILAEQPDVEPQVLVTHYQESGDRHAAFDAALKAAYFAQSQLAFDRAAMFYRAALETGDLTSAESARLHRRLADALELAGRGREAAAAYLKAAECGGRTIDYIDLNRRAAEQLLISGNTEAGLDAIREVLRAVNLRLPESSRQAYVSLVFRRLLVVLRGIQFDERPESQLSDSDRILIDTCWSVAAGLSMVDPIRGADFQARHFLLALDAGEPFRVARALAMEIAHRAVPGRRVEAKVQKLLQVASSLAERLDHPYLRALMASSSAVISWSNGRWKVSLERADEAQHILTEQCAGPSWETVTSQIFSMGALVRMGELKEHRARMPPLIRNAHERGNKYAEISIPLLSYAHVTTLADDEPAQAAETVHRLIGAWSTARYDLQRFWATYACAETCLYMGDGASAWSEIETNARNVRNSLLLRVQTIRINWLDLSARSALAAVRSGRPELLRVARQLADRLDREDVRWARGLAGLVRAAIVADAGQATSAATLLARAEGDFLEAQMKLHAAAARWARTSLVGDSSRAAPPLDRVFAEEGVRCPPKLVSMLAPGPWTS
jgi:serine/threonine protein kinase